MVLLIILAVIIIILHFPLNVYVSFIGGKPAVRVKFAGITLFDLDKAMNKKKDKSDDKYIDDPDSKKRKKSKKDDKKDKAEKKRKSRRAAHEAYEEDVSEKSEGVLSEDKEKAQTDDKDSDKKPKKKLGDIIDGIKEKLELVKLLWRICGRNIKKIFKDIRIDNIFIDFTAAAEDAHKAALLYGKLNAAVYNGIAFIKRYVKMSIKSIGIRCRYDIEKPVFDCSVRINIRPAVVIGNAFVLIFRLLVNLGKILPLLRSDSSGEKDKTEEAKEKVTK
ncbi:MAG: hypothetical protein IJ446_06430 [Oscillospiraceae bacterium]|nr:hypothetical protein [Oscillospiraceae bacterium]